MPRQLLGLWILVVVAVAGASVVSHIPFLPEGPSWQVAATSRDLWERHTIRSDRFQELYDRLVRLSSDGPAYWQDVFAIGADGKLYPVHGLLLSPLAAPFYGVFGEPGFWIFNQLVLLCLVASTWRLARAVTPGLSEILVFVVMVLGTELAAYSFGFHYDLLGAALVVCGFDLARSAPLVGGFVMALSVFVRITNILYLPFLLLAAAPWRSSRSGTAAFGTGALLGLALFALTSDLLWGSPFTSVYARKPGFYSGVPRFDNDSTVFSLSIFFSDWRRKLFDRRIGLVTSNPILVLLPWALIVSRRRPGWRFLGIVTAAALLQIIVIFGYRNWALSHSGNRYLLAAVFLLLLPILDALAAVLARGKRAEEPSRASP